jgi:hypothetical protein
MPTKAVKQARKRVSEAVRRIMVRWPRVAEIGEARGIINR